MFGLDWKQSFLWGWFIFSFLLFFTIGKTSSSNTSFEVFEGHKEKWKRAQDVKQEEPSWSEPLTRAVCPWARSFILSEFQFFYLWNGDKNI